MVVTFRCKQSGNTVKFSDPNDIELMRKEVDYDEVKEPITEVPTFLKPEVEVKRGRPRKEATPAE